MGARVFRLTASPRTVSTGAVATLRYAGGGRNLGYAWSGTLFQAGLVDLPRFNSSLDFDEKGWTGDTVPQSSNLTLAPYNKAGLSAASAYYWPSAPVLVEVGDETTGTFTTILNGIVDNVATNDAGQIIFTLADLSRALDVPLLNTRFGGTGGVDGDLNTANRIKRHSWGRTFNVEGLVFDAANDIYEFNDPGRPLNAFVAIRDKGRAGTFTTLAWQGSVAATLTALQASTPAQGGAVAAPSIGCVKWWTQPVGPLCADLQGESGTSTYTELAASIARRIMQSVSGPALNTITAINTARPYSCGIHVSDENETIAAVLDRLLLGVSLLWTIDTAGNITIRPWTFASPVEALLSKAVTRDKMFPPVATRRLGYQKNERVHSAGEISTYLTDPIMTVDPASVTLQADTNGVVTSGQLPITIDADVNVAGVDVSTATTFVLTDSNVTTGTVSSAGTFNLTAASATGTIAVTGTYNGKSVTKTIPVTVNKATTIQSNPITVFAPVSSSSYPATSAAPQGGFLSFATPSSGIVSLKVNLSYYGAGLQLAGELVYRHPGDTTWTSGSSEHTGSVAAGGSVPTPGVLAWNDSYTFSASTAYEFGIILRIAAGTGPVTPTGSAGFNT